MTLKTYGLVGREFNFVLSRPINLDVLNKNRAPASTTTDAANPLDAESARLTPPITARRGNWPSTFPFLPAVLIGKRHSHCLKSISEAVSFPGRSGLGRQAGSVRNLLSGNPAASGQMKSDRLINASDRIPETRLNE
jgi:hypothetical protein